MSSITTPDGANVVIFLSGDLIFASRVRSAATEAGLEFRLAGNLPDDLHLNASHIIVDLSTRSKAIDGLIEACETRFPNAEVIAYAPHVQIQRLRDARLQGIPTVLTRGQFNDALATMFAGS